MINISKLLGNLPPVVARLLSAGGGGVLLSNWFSTITTRKHVKYVLICHVVSVVFLQSPN